MRRIRTFAEAAPRLLVLSALAGAVGLVAVAWGPGAGLADLFSGDSSALLIFSELRVPRVLTALLVGGVLGASGAAIQGLFRNPLAGPDVLGVSAGASAGGLAFLLVFGAASLGITAGAFCGAGLTASAVYFLGRSASGSSLYRLLLGGLAISSLLGGLIALMLTFAREMQVTQYLFWVMGSLENRRWSHFWTLLPGAALALGALIPLAGSLNLLALGDETAKSLGLRTDRQKLLILFFTVLGTASAVSVTGAIGFIGLLVPHGVRLLWGNDFRFLVPLSALAGALLLTGADLAARWVFQPFELPVGVLTALAGAPFFLFLLFRKKPVSGGMP